MALPTLPEDSVTVQVVRLVQELTRVVARLSERMDDLEGRPAVCDTQHPATVVVQSDHFPIS